jgi:deoxyribonuclease V
MSAVEHMWDIESGQAMDLQDRLRGQLSLDWDGRSVESVAGVDVHFEGGQAAAAIVIMSFPELEGLEAMRAKADLTFPYVPGLLAFREGPAVLAAWEQLGRDPDLLMFDAHGIAHPRGFGLASHLGLLLDKPSIGVAKSKLYGTHEVPGPRKGDSVTLWDERLEGEPLGEVLRTRDEVKPVFVSPGHRIDILHAVDFTLRCCTRYRLPEPTRWAHRVADGADFPLGA